MHCCIANDTTLYTTTNYYYKSVTLLGFVKQVGFKPEVKERGSYGCAEWWRNWYQNEVDKERKGADSRDKMKHNKRSDQLFLQRMIKVAEQE